MLTKKKLSIIVISILLAGALIYVINIISSNMNKSLKKNYGLANMTINVYGKDGTSSVTDIDSVVPTADELVKDLTEKGYSITRYDKIDNLNISVQRIFAEKNDRFIDICYGVSDMDAKTVFDHFADTYDKYYLLAQNESYVYCISDKKTFKYAGFKSLANNGIQYIYE
jgi:type II secretory pathway pseudopilin PulG